MAMSAGTRIGAYEVIGPLGAGGMGEVYRARDVRLGREVAVKILPPALATDPDRLARLRREAQVLATLNHPNIAQLHELEETESISALIMELVEGTTLADRIATGPPPLDETLAIAKQIALALEAAHAHGIVHRDLKPGNIKVRPDGAVKVLDFGLAKTDPGASGARGASGALGATGAVTSPAITQAGLILGTAAYMAPEQARGKPADARADVWAFGVVLFEMLTGGRAFEGADVSDTLASVLKSEPEWSALPPATPPAIRRVLRRCLTKDLNQRLQHVGDARLEIDEALSEESTRPAETPRRHPGHQIAWTAAALLIGVALGAGAVWRNGASQALAEMRLDIDTGEEVGSQFALSPDGGSIAYATIRVRSRQIWLRRFDSTTARPVPNTDGGEYPFWSADGRSLGFFAQNQLRRIDLDSGEVRSLASVVTPAGGSWNADGTILYVPVDNGGLYRVSAGGGESVAITPRQQPRIATRSPQFLPDGRRFLFFVARGSEPAGVYLGSLDDDVITRVLAADLPAIYALDHVWFVRESSLFAQRFDAAGRTLNGTAHRIADNITLGLGVAAIAAAADGPVAYRAGANLNLRQLVWFDRAGKRLGPAGEAGGGVSNPSLSPDGRYVMVQRSIDDNLDLWLLDLSRPGMRFTRFTDHPGIDSLPQWSPDSRRVFFNHVAEGSGGEPGRQRLRVAYVDRSQPDEPLSFPGLPGVVIACDWSLDGRFLLFKHFDETAGASDLWVLPFEGDRTPRQVTSSRYEERDGQFSRDGRWLAYESDETGASEIYLQPFPGPGEKIRISHEGGSQVRWRRDAGELFFVAPDQTLMAVAIDWTRDVPRVGTPFALFKVQMGPVRSISRQQYVVSADGQRFLIATLDAPTPTPITLLLNWQPPTQR